MRKAKRTKFSGLRERAGLTLEEAAALLEVSPRSVYRYEEGASAPGRLAIRVLKDAADKRTASSADLPAFRFIDLFAGIGGLRLGF